MNMKISIKSEYRRKLFSYPSEVHTSNATYYTFRVFQIMESKM